ncbi:MAG: hypothetical protein H6807_06065 [Planctomycetes bacterium]|nr:hypothetical protein [Planctomycetota bacterium]
MSDGRLLRIAEVLLDSYGERLFLDCDEIRRSLDDDEELMSRCLDFLIGRDELILAPGRTPRLFQRRNLTDAVHRRLADRRGALPEDLAEDLDVPVAITCEILGWLEREGRVRARSQGEDVWFEPV